MRAHKKSASWVSSKWVKSNERRRKKEQREKKKSVKSVLTMVR